MKKTMEQATLGGGCFWCLEATYQLVKGVINVTSGYAGGNIANPTYEQVSSGATGHAEVVQINFDPSVISYQQLLDIFWTIHDPSSINHQGPDYGEQYRSIILYHNDSQRKLALESVKKAFELWDKPIVTQIEPLERFWPAEEYHQNYFKKNQDASYCQAIINPKLIKLRKSFNTLLTAD